MSHRSIFSPSCPGALYHTTVCRDLDIFTNLQNNVLVYYREYILLIVPDKLKVSNAIVALVRIIHAR